MPVVNVPPWTNPPHRAALFPEFQRQLREQQDGINAQLCDTWQQNRQQYLNQGRSALGAQLQAEFQERSGHQPNTAAPHNSDQVGGGHPDPTGIPANRQINSAIGGGWPARIGTIDAAVNAVPPLERLVTQMNVTLSVNQI